MIVNVAKLLVFIKIMCPTIKYLEFRTTVSRTIKKYLDQKDFTTKNSAGRSKLINKEGQKILKNIVKQNNRKSAEQIKNKFNEKIGINVSTKTIRRALHEIMK